MRMILAALAALLTFASSPAKASFAQDDRYFDSRAKVQKAATRHVRIARPRHKVKRVPWRAGGMPVDTGSRHFLRPAFTYQSSLVGLSPLEVAATPRRDKYSEPDRSAQTHATILGGRPAGCPARFCGCGASLHLFGRIIPFLNLAANWLRFPRALPAPGMAAARRGHVFVLKQHIEGKKWLVFDANSGRGRTRMHERSIAGYAIVNPRAGPS